MVMIQEVIITAPQTQELPQLDLDQRRKSTSWISENTPFKLGIVIVKETIEEGVIVVEISKHQHCRSWTMKRLARDTRFTKSLL